MKNNCLLLGTLLFGINPVFSFAETVNCLGFAPTAPGNDKTRIVLDFTPGGPASLKFLNPDNSNLTSWIVGPYTKMSDPSGISYVNESSTAEESLVIKASATEGQDLESLYTFKNSSLGSNVPLLCSFNRVQNPPPRPNPNPNPNPNPDPPNEVMVTGNADGTCSPLESHIFKDEPADIVLRTSSNQMFLLEAPELGISLMIAPNSSGRKSITPKKEGAFKFTCGVHGATKQSNGIFMVM